MPSQALSQKKLLIVEVRSRGPVFHYRYDIFRSKGWQLFYLSATAAGDYAFDGVKTVASRELRGLMSAAGELHALHQFTAVCTTDESSIIATACIAEALGLPGLSIDAARCSRNKLLMREAHQKHGAPHPRFARCDTVEEALAFAERVGYPVVIKPTLGADAEHVYKVSDVSDMRRRHLDASRGNATHSHRFAEAEGEDMGPHTLLVEEFLDGTEHCVEAVVHDGEVVLGSIADRLSIDVDVFDSDLYATPTRLAAQQIALLHDAIRQGARAQGLRHGVLHAELRFHRGMPHIVEIAARPGGGSLQFMARISYGYCPILAVLEVAQGLAPAAQSYKPTGRVAVGLTMLSGEGRLEAVHVPRRVLSNPDIFNFRILPPLQAVLRRPPNGNDILGFIGAAGDTLEQALNTARTAAAQTEVLLAPLCVTDLRNLHDMHEASAGPAGARLA